MKKRLGNVFLASALDSPRRGDLRIMLSTVCTKDAPAEYLLKPRRMCSNSFLSQLTLRTKYHRIQGGRDCLVMDIHHGFFRTFCTDCVWRSPSDALQCDLRQGIEIYPSFGERFVVGLFYEVTG